MNLDNASQQELQSWGKKLLVKYQQFKDADLKLDLTRGKPGNAQLDLADAIEDLPKNK